VIALDNLTRIRDRARGLLETNRRLVNEFLAGHSSLDCQPSRLGTTVFPRLKAGRTEEFVKILREQFETSVVPGDFFEQPQHFRIGFGGATENVRGGLKQIDAALNSFGG
jgi:aspartate/methionine/tyrosine aminotransferase